MNDIPETAENRKLVTQETKHEQIINLLTHMAQSLRTIALCVIDIWEESQENKDGQRKIMEIEERIAHNEGRYNDTTLRNTGSDVQ